MNKYYYILEVSSEKQVGKYFRNITFNTERELNEYFGSVPKPKGYRFRVFWINEKHFSNGSHNKNATLLRVIKGGEE